MRAYLSPTAPLSAGGDSVCRKLLRKEEDEVGLPPGTLVPRGGERTRRARATVIDYDEARFQEREGDVFYPISADFMTRLFLTRRSVFLKIPITMRRLNPWVESSLLSSWCLSAL